MSKLEFKPQDRQSIDFAEEERIKNKNLFPLETVKGIGLSSIKFTNPLPAGTYTFSAINTSSSTTSSASLVEVYSDGEWIGVFGIEKSYNRKSATRTLNQPFNEIRFYAGDTFIEDASFTFDKIQLEKGSQATEYQKYNGNIKHFWSGRTISLWQEMSIETSDNWVNNYTFGNIESFGIVRDNDGLIIQKEGKYYAEFNVSDERTDTSKSNLYVSILKNGKDEISRQSNMTGDNLRHMLCSSGILSCVKGDVINMRVYRDGTQVQGKLINLNFIIKEV